MQETALNDPDKVYRAQATDPKVLEPLYWVLEDSIYKDDLVLARAVYEDFLYIAKYCKDDLVKTLQPAYVNRLREIAFELHDETHFKERKPITIKQASHSKKLPFPKEENLRNYLATNPTILSDALSDRIRIIGMEVETDFDYRCDILARSEQFYYPIELKIGQATHAVVSQITKYCYYFYRRFRYGFYKPIRGVVCANGFCDWSINELRRDGVLIFSIIPDGEGVRLSQIT